MTVLLPFLISLINSFKRRLSYNTRKFSFVLCLSIIFPLFYLNAEAPFTGSPEISWRIMDKANMAYDEGDFSTALIYAEKAKINRKNECDWAIKTLEEALTPKAVKAVEDTIDNILPILKERNSDDAIMIISNVLQKRNATFFNNSVWNIRNFISDYSVYPEADYLIGKIYVLEGEYDIAKSYFQSALNNEFVFDIPDSKYDILYDQANIALLQDDFTTYEELLLSIIQYDTNFIKNNTISSYVDAAMNSAIKEKSVDKYFLLYRNNSIVTIPAYFKLATLYKSLNEIDRALQVSTMGVLSSVTRLYEVLSLRNQKFEYKTFELLINESLTYSDVYNWLLQNDIWNGFYTFANLISSKGNVVMAKEIYNVIIKFCPDITITNLSKQAISML